MVKEDLKGVQEMDNKKSVCKLNNPVIYLLIFWSLIWKGIGLWRSARDNRMPWFIAILFVNSMGILEMTYLFLSKRNKLK